VREYVRPDDRRRDAAEPRKRPAEPAPADNILALQRIAGNRAVSGLLARDGNKNEPKDEEEKGSTQTLGLGDEFGVIPLESANWELKRSELTVLFVENPLVSKLMEAHAKGKNFASVFLSTQRTMSRMASVYLSGVNTSNDPGRRRLVTMTLNFKEVTHEPVK
jgi:hypothetical protein